MSVKRKIKRLNIENAELRDALETERLSNSRLRQKIDTSKNVELLENLVKFAVTNYGGNLRSGIQIESIEVDKMENLKLYVKYEPQQDSYIILVEP